jgi:hypothetical protein
MQYCDMSAESQNCTANTLVARQWLSSRHVIAATAMQTITEVFEAITSQ